ncbi:ABC transporter substrate-binding protein, partial [Achromobacter xylosoxidans]
AAALDVAPAGEQMVRDVTGELAKAEAMPATRARALLLINRSGAPQGAGRGTAAAEIMRLAGLDNVLAGQQGYKPLSPEAIGALAPDLIIVTRESLQASGGLEGFARLPGIAATQAAAKQRIIVMDDLLILGLGPRLPQALIQLKQEAAHAMAR